MRFYVCVYCWRYTHTHTHTSCIQQFLLNHIHGNKRVFVKLVLFKYLKHIYICIFYIIFIFTNKSYLYLYSSILKDQHSAGVSTNHWHNKKISS